METTQFLVPTRSWCTMQVIIKSSIETEYGNTKVRIYTICMIRMQEKEGAKANMVMKQAEKQLILPIRTALSGKMWRTQSQHKKNIIQQTTYACG